MFRYVLRYLVTGQLPLNCLSSGEVEELSKAADTYHLPGLARLLQAPVKDTYSVNFRRPVAQAALDSTRTLVTRLTDDWSYVWALGENTYGANSHVIIKVEIVGLKPPLADWVFIGVIGNVPTDEAAHFHQSAFGLSSRGCRVDGGVPGQRRADKSSNSEDVLEVDIDCPNNVLTLRNITGRWTEQFRLRGSSEWRLLVEMYCEHNGVRILETRRV